MAQEVLLRPALVAQMLGVSRSTVYRWFWEGLLKGVKIGSGTVRIYQSSVIERLNHGD
jgi:iron complex outermembrane receptor protein